MKSIILYLIIALFACIWGVYICSNLENYQHESWIRGYADCMNHVVDALISHDEVRLGNLVINEPNAYVSDITFFVVDPNLMGVVINAEDSIMMDCYYNSLCDGYEYPDIDPKEVPGV